MSLVYPFKKKTGMLSFIDNFLLNLSELFHVPSADLICTVSISCQKSLNAL